MVTVYKLSFAIWLLYFASLFFNSFFYALDIEILSLKFSVLETLFLFYISLYLYLYLFIKNSIIYINYTRESILFYFFSLVCLFIVGEYTLCIFLAFMFLIYLIEFKQRQIENFVDFVFFALFNYALMLVFASGNYLIYFLDFFVFIYFYYKQENNFSKIDAFFYTIIALFLISNMKKIEDFLYEIYVWIDLVDEVNHVNSEVLYVLISLNILILSVLRYNRQKL